MKPEVGRWYRYREGARFKVTKVTDDMIEAEWEDGMYNEMPLSEWQEDVRKGWLDNSSPP